MGVEYGLPKQEKEKNSIRPNRKYCADKIEGERGEWRGAGVQKEHDRHGHWMQCDRGEKVESQYMDILDHMESDAVNTKMGSDIFDRTDSLPVVVGKYK